MGLFSAIFGGLNDLEISNCELMISNYKQLAAQAKTSSEKAYFKAQVIKEQERLKLLKRHKSKK